MGLLGGNGSVLDSLWNDEYLARPDCNASITKLNVDTAAQNQKEIVRVVVLVPYELALHLDHHEVMPVELTDDAGLPVIRKGPELMRKIYRFHDGGLPMSTCDIIASARHAYRTARYDADNLSC